MPRIDADMKHYAAITAERIGVDYARRERGGQPAAWDMPLSVILGRDWFRESS